MLAVYRKYQMYKYRLYDVACTAQSSLEGNGSWAD